MSKIKDFESHLFGAKYAAINNLTIAPPANFELPQTDKLPVKGDSFQTSIDSPQQNNPAKCSSTLMSINVVFLENFIADRRQTKA